MSKVRVRMSGTVEMDVSQIVEMDSEDWQRIREATDSDLDCPILSPLLDYIRWNDIEPSHLSIDDICTVDADGIKLEDLRD